MGSVHVCIIYILLLSLAYFCAHSRVYFGKGSHS